MDKQYNGQMKKDKMTNSGIQNFTQKTKDRTKWTTLKTGVDHRCLGRGLAVSPHIRPNFLRQTDY
jgi:hypothetical protein